MNCDYDISVSQSFVVAFSNGNMLTCLLKTLDLSNAASKTSTVYWFEKASEILCVWLRNTL